LLFAALYFSEGAPIGFIWLALPTRLKDAEVPLEKITELTALLVLPWTFKFLWAPLVDVLRGARWSLRHWIVAAQAIMGLTLAPLLWLDPLADFALMVASLLVHALAAATQDVAIDALCISETLPEERGRYNGWMQAGMLLGRASLGGGALVMAAWIGDRAVIVLLMLAVLSSSVLVVMSCEQNLRVLDRRQRWRHLQRAAAMAVRSRNTWLGLAFGLLGGAAFKSLEVVYGPFLIDRGYSQADIGWFSAGPMIVSMIAGSLVGGRLADRVGRRSSVTLAMLLVVAMVTCLAISDHLMHQQGGKHLLTFLAGAAFGIGLFTAASYALFMDLTDPDLSASQFSAFMGSTNGCESWSTYVIGQIISAAGYASGFLTMSAVSLVALLLLVWIRPRSEDERSRSRPAARKGAGGSGNTDHH
jgi:MFS family permease